MHDIHDTPDTGHRTGNRAHRRLRGAAALTATVAFGFLAPTAAGAQAPPPIDDLTSDPGCEPDLPCDIDPEPDPCDPDTEICDLVSGGDGPDDPCEGDDPAPECEPGSGDEPQVDVDLPVPATPNFTG